MGPLTSEMRDFLKGFFRERVRRIVDAEQKLASYNERIDGYFDRRSLRDALK